MTEEQKEQLERTAEEMYQIIKPIIDKFFEIARAIVSAVTEFFEYIKEIATIKVSVRTKKIKKGKKYIHSYKKYELWRLLR